MNTLRIHLCRKQNELYDTPTIHSSSKCGREFRPGRINRNILKKVCWLGSTAVTSRWKTHIVHSTMFCVTKTRQPQTVASISQYETRRTNLVHWGWPLYLPCVLHSIKRSYLCRYPAVINALTFFHQFWVHPNDRQIQVLLNLITKEVSKYHGLPMGVSNSPAIATRLRNVFLQRIRSTYKEFQG